MEKEYLLLPRFEYGGHNEMKLDKKMDLGGSGSSVKGSILFTEKPVKKKQPFRWIRIRSFFTKHKKFKRMMEFSIHPTGVHMLRMAVLYSEGGCKMCRVYVEKNLF